MFFHRIRKYFFTPNKNQIKTFVMKNEYCFSNFIKLGDFLRYSGFLHQKKNCSPGYNWNIVESGVKTP
jgi:hypothetical protein